MRRDLRTSLRIFGPLECLRAFCDVRFKSHPKLELLLGQAIRKDEISVEFEERDAINACMAVRSYIINVERAWGERFTCLMASLAAKRILARKGVNTVLYVGVRFSGDGEKAKDDFKAHSWLKYGSRVIVGDHDIEKFKVIKVFS